MKIAYVTPFDSRNLCDHNNWAGTGYYIGQALKKQSIPIEYIGPLEEKLALQIVSKFKSRYHKYLGKNYIKYIEPLISRDYGRQIYQKLNSIKSDVVLSAGSDSIAYLECNQPIVFWADATFANIIDFYPAYSNLCQESLQNAHLIQSISLQKSRLAIYSSEWAAQTAIDYYQTDPKKVKVVPFGANIESNFTLDATKNLVESRPTNQCKLLFLGVDWFRKGGDIALEVTKKLNASGLNTELTIIGCQPITEDPLPDFVKPLGYISKSTPEGKNKIYQLIASSHFLILPSIADCTPIVFCEANSLGVPCISRRVGGIPTIIKDDLNGKLFDRDSDATEYCKYISNIFTNYTQYKKLALSAFNEYESRLNWKVAGQKVKELLMSLG
ncbi:glycosyltransferase family 4 protein [Dolichospermum sp. ST_sed1]|nr:glycosyltransferase family 4 protein [Dolichospermum sp. ST_sed1]MDD1424400.1 glycosyltransferase family 4 protein [Dolichospermum sp. ST_sed9]MDD1430635.1 glycosyltransferase family 4 protein [Dolichospermum sp. ST_sed6]MDD1436644.1 glycosyltransferase family 4 protein [Dolichospermum sp. ST_sed10]MDD1439114.1 glycosyltransferase family 4 protein [Dolichospermum sp. ST_sed3]MDD1444675.1 glycosyltransferase family 4 protein [Dolichospermum sp. ST_sed8]MDD1455596.1 glycosyltransferase famil